MTAQPRPAWCIRAAAPSISSHARAPPSRLPHPPLLLGYVSRRRVTVQLKWGGGQLMRKAAFLCILAAIFAVVVLNGSAMADEKHKANLLGGSEETPAVITGASGSFSMAIATGDASFEFELSYNGIEGGSVTQAH